MVTGGEAAVEALAAALDHVIEEVESSGLDSLDDLQLVALMQRFEAVRNRMALVDHRVLREAEERNLAESLCQSRLTRVLTQALRISAGEAVRRVRAAEQLGQRTSMLGEPVPPQRPVLAAAQREGAVTPEQASIVVAGLAKVDRDGFDPADVAAGECGLTSYARTFGPRDLKLCVDRFVECLDPDGSVSQEEVNLDRRYFELKQLRDGSWRGELRLTGPVGVKLQAVLGPLAKPRVNTVTTADGRLVEEPDERSHGQRLHDGLEQVCDRVLRAGELPNFGGVPATVVVTIDEENLRTRSGTGTSSDGTRLSVREVLALADQAEVISTVLAKSGAVLTLGRSRRIASKTQTLALIARDAGCSFPGCASPPEWCERHHIRAWVDGGRTDLDNLTLLCRYHHHNFAARGWSCRLNLDGIPEWLPPKYVDPDRRPLVNTRIQAALTRYVTVA